MSLSLASFESTQTLLSQLNLSLTTLLKMTTERPSHFFPASLPLNIWHHLLSHYADRRPSPLSAGIIFWSVLLTAVSQAFRIASSTQVLNKLFVG